MHGDLDIKCGVEGEYKNIRSEEYIALADRKIVEDSISSWDIKRGVEGEDKNTRSPEYIYRGLTEKVAPPVAPTEDTYRTTTVL